MDVEDEIVGAAVRVGDACEDGGGAAGDEGRGARVAIACGGKSQIVWGQEGERKGTYQEGGSSGS